MKRLHQTGWLALVALSLSTPTRAQERKETQAPVARFIRTCTVYIEPQHNSMVACQKKAGTQIYYTDSAPGGFVQIETADCAGYVSDACVSLPEITQRTGINYEPRTRKYRVRLDLGGSLDGTLATLAGTTDVSRGDGYSFGVRVQIAINKRFYVTAKPSYNALGLSRKVDMSGALLDPNPAEFTQSIKYWGFESLFGFVVQRRLVEDKPSLDPEVALEAGFQFLSPVKAEQTDSAGTKTQFTSPDKLLLFLAGPRLDLAFSQGFGMAGFLHAFYNLRSTGGSRLFGARLGVALTIGLN